MYFRYAGNAFQTACKVFPCFLQMIQLKMGNPDIEQGDAVHFRIPRVLGTFVCPDKVFQRAGVIALVEENTGNVVQCLGLHFGRCQPWRAKRRLVDPSSREAALFSRRALRQRENKVGLRTWRPVIGSQVRSSNELAKLLRSAW